MSRYEFTINAKADLFDILSYISKDNPAAADRVEKQILQSCEFLAERPLTGHFRRDLTPLPVRFWSVPRYPNYLIVYNPAPSPVTIIRILHAAQDTGSRLET